MDFSCRRLSLVLMVKVGAPMESSMGEPLASRMGLVAEGSSVGRETVRTVGLLSKRD